MQWIVPTAAKGLSFLTGTFVAYVLNKNLTFQQTYSSSRKFRQFLFLYGMTFLANVGVHWGTIRLVVSNPTIAFVAATATSTCLNFLGQKFWVFQTPTPSSVGGTTMATTLSIVIPCFNEKDNLSLILERFKSVVTRDDIEVVLVDNGSTDGTQNELNRLLPNYPFVRLVTVPSNEGYGHGILTGLRSAKGEFLAWTHADMQTDPMDVVKALEIAEKQSDPTQVYVKGNRRGRSIFDTFFTVGMSFFELFVMWKWLWDINAQPNLFHRSLFDDIGSDAPKDFALDLFFLYKAKSADLEIFRFPVRFPERIHGHSKWNTSLSAKWKFIRRTMTFSWKLRQGLNVGQ